MRLATRVFGLRLEHVEEVHLVLLLDLCQGPGKAPEAADKGEIAPYAEFCIGVCADRCDGWREEGYREAYRCMVRTRLV